MGKTAPDPAVVAPPETRVVAAAGGGPAFAVVLAEGRGLLTLAQQALSPLADIRDLSLELPDLRIPFDLAGGADRFRNRRCRLLRATLATDVARLEAAIADPDRRSALEAAGIIELRLHVAPGALRLSGRAVIGGREAGFTARVAMRATATRKLRLSLRAVRLYGFLPVPGRLVASAILTGAFGATEGGLAVPAGAAATNGGAAAPHARALRPAIRWSIDLDLLDAACFELFAGHGWRLPDIGAARLHPSEIGDGRLKLTWHTPDPPAISGAATATDIAYPDADPDERDDARFDEGDALLGRGDVDGALGAYRRDLAARPGDSAAASRLLELLVANRGSLREADQLAAAMLSHPDPSDALLARAIAAAEHGDRATSAAIYEQVARRADERGDREDSLAARLAAAEQWILARRIDRAGPSLENVLAERPGYPRALAFLNAAGEDGEQRPQALRILANVMVANGDLAGADRVFESRLAIAPDRAARAAIETERARVRLLGPDGDNAALALLRHVPLDVAPEEALVLRADLGERLGNLADAIPALNELGARARRAGDQSTADRLEDRVTELLARAHTSATADPQAPGAVPRRRRTTSPTAVVPAAAPAAPEPVPTGASAPIDLLEKALVVNPTDPTAAEELAAIYAGIPDPKDRADALSGLLRRALGLSADRRKELYADVGASAEATGDLDRAERAYWRAATIEAEPALRANFLVAHARVLLARGELQTAIGELEEALARVPDHAGALALLAELSFRTEDWERARQLYRRLELAGDATDVISRELLMYRRALLAEVTGADAEAEAYFREVAILNPRHVEARQSLAEIALRRGDFGDAALRLEEVLRLLPPDALDSLLELRQRLGGIYVQLQDWTSARYYGELVLAQDPGSVPGLELLVDIYQRLGLHHEAARACERLSRLYAEPSRRAEILFRQGEILRAHIGDPAAALDAFLKSSDLDPRFMPTLVRLVDAFWARGDFESVAEIAIELVRAGSDEIRDVDLGIRLAIGAALGTPAAVLPPALAFSWDAPRVARALAEAAGFLGGRPSDALAPALMPFVGKPDPADSASTDLLASMKDLVQEDPCGWNMGAARALAYFADALGDLVTARVFHGLLVFVDSDHAAARRLDEIGEAPTPGARALRTDGETCHPRCAGPLRAVLRAVGPALLGCTAVGGGAVVDLEAEASGGERLLSPGRTETLKRLVQDLHVPTFEVAIREQARRIAVHMLPARPAMLSVSPAAEELPEGEWRFLAARALDELRTGFAAARDLDADEIAALLEGIECALVDSGEPTTPLARAVRDWLATPERTAELPTGDERWALLNDVRTCRLAPTDWESFRKACGYTADRMGLLACGHPLDALGALAHDPIEADAAHDARARHRALLKTPRLRELLHYMLSADYAQALAGAPEG